MSANQTASSLSPKAQSMFAVALSAILALTAFAGAWWCSTPWCDELTFLDSAVNFLGGGSWHSEVFYLVNNPGFALIAATAVKVFGAYHQTVVAVCCLFAFLSSWLILDSLVRRGLVKNLEQHLLFVLLFWSGFVFSGIILNGRPDTMTLFLTVGLLDVLFPAADRSISYKSVLVRSFALMMVSAYTLPLISLLSLGGVFVCRRRRMALGRTLAVVAGGGLAWMLIAVFYAYHHELIRFAGFYAAFNSITGERHGTILQRILSGYGHDVTALFVLGLATGLVVVFRPLRTRGRVACLSIVAAIPVGMVLCGRYQQYYSWMLYVPACACLSVFSGSLRMVFQRTLLVGAVCLSAVHHYLVFTMDDAGLCRARSARAFVQENARFFVPGTTVVVADDTVGDVSLYYPLLERGVDLWFRGPAFLRTLSDEQKFEHGLSIFVKDEDLRKKILSKVMHYQTFMPLLPNREALVVFVSPENREEVRPLFERAGYGLRFVLDDGVRSVYRMSPLARLP